MSFIELIGEFTASNIRVATPVLLAGLGILITAYGGLLNIGCEGIMLIATFTAVAGAYMTQNVWMGLLLALAIGALLGLAFAFFTVTLRANQVVIGAAFNILGSGLSATLYRLISQSGSELITVASFENMNLFGLGEVTFLGKAFFAHMPIVYIAFLLVPILSFFLFKTSMGLNLRSVGENPKAADTMGINVYRTRYLASTVGAMLMSAGGAFLSTGLLNFFSEEMVTGRGYIALAAIAFGKYKPAGVMGAALLFSTGNVIANILQSQSSGVPHSILMTIPYLLTILVLAFSGGKEYAPASLGAPYRKG